LRRFAHGKSVLNIKKLFFKYSCNSKYSSAIQAQEQDHPKDQKQDEDE
jgi:hypothetical protein